MFAIVSDIHGNLEALSVVLDEIDRRGITDILCLGDVIGYGPNPLECIDLIQKRTKVALMGNHDFAVMYEPFNFNQGAEAACFWTRSQFEGDPDRDRRQQRWKFLCNLSARFRGPHLVAVHASPRRPINEYIFPDDIYTNPTKFVSIFERVERLCFVGHTHVPGVFLEGPDFYSPDELDYRYEIGEEKAVINVGSVGQPRDRDPRSSFVVVHLPGDAPMDGSANGEAGAEKGGYIEFVRLPYDVDTTARKIEAIPALDNFLGTRLLDGR